MLASLAEAACVLERQDYLAAAVANGSFLLNSMTANGYLRHTYKDGKAKVDGYLQDYAQVIDGLLTLHQATFSGEWLRQAIRLAEIMIEQLKLLAHKKDVPYQSLMKMFLAERVEKELEWKHEAPKLLRAYETLFSS